MVRVWIKFFGDFFFQIESWLKGVVSGKVAVRTEYRVLFCFFSLFFFFYFLFVCVVRTSRSTKRHFGVFRVNSLVQLGSL